MWILNKMHEKQPAHLRKIRKFWQINENFMQKPNTNDSYHESMTSVNNAQHCEKKKKTRYCRDTGCVATYAQCVLFFFSALPPSKRCSIDLNTLAIDRLLNRRWPREIYVTVFATVEHRLCQFTPRFLLSTSFGLSVMRNKAEPAINSISFSFVHWL